MNFIEFDEIKKTFSAYESELSDLGAEEQKHSYEKEKLPNDYKFKGFIDSCGKVFQAGDLDTLDVPYESILIFNFLGWNNDTQSNQFPLFSELFTSAKVTHQAYSKNGLKSIYNFSQNYMKKQSEYASSYDTIVGRGDAIKTRIFDVPQNKKTSLITLQALFEPNVPGFVFDNDYLIKVPGPFLTKFFIDNFCKIQKRNYILYPATVNHDGDKNQRGFAKAIEKEFVNNHKIIFCGNIRDRAYASEVSSILNKKGIDHCFTGKIEHYNLRLLYLMSKGVCLYSNKDFSPRAICEGVWAGLPFITKKCVPMPGAYHPMGAFYEDTQIKEFNEKFLELTNFNGHSEIHNYCKENLTLSKVYYNIFKDISSLHETWLDKI